MPVSGHAQINWIDVQEEEVKQSAELVPMQKNIPTRSGTVMPGDYTTHTSSISWKLQLCLKKAETVLKISCRDIIV